MTTDDELLALAKRCIRTDGSAIPIVTDPRAIIALIERYHAEVERLTRERDEARQENQYLRDEKAGLDAALKQAHDDERIAVAMQQNAEHLRDAAESALATVTRERDEARRESEHWQDMADHSEAALAAAQKRVGVLREALEGVCNYFSDWCYSSDDGCEAEQSANARYKARAALKESGNGDETVRQGQQGKSES